MGFDARHDLISPSGATINVVWREAEGMPLAAIHVSHGLGEEANDYARFAGLLAAGGFHVYAHDHRGHGTTRAPDALQGHFGSGDAAEKVTSDMAAVEDFIAGRHPDLPVILFGSGSGAVIALNHFLRHPDRVAVLALECPPPPITRKKRALLAWERFRRGSDVPSHVMRAAEPGMPVSVGSWLALAAMRDRLARGRHPVSRARRIPILIYGHNPFAEQLGTMGFSNVTLRREIGARSGGCDMAAFREWAESVLG